MLLYNKYLCKHVTARYYLYLGNVENFANHFRNAPVGGPTALGFAIRLFYLSCCFAPHMSSQTAIIGCCGSSYGDRYIHSLVVNHRRFTAFTSGYASVPTYGGNARLTTSCYIPFLFALGNGNCPIELEPIVILVYLLGTSKLIIFCKKVRGCTTP